MPTNSYLLPSLGMSPTVLSHQVDKMVGLFVPLDWLEGVDTEYLTFEMMQFTTR